MQRRPDASARAWPAGRSAPRPGTATCSCTRAGVPAFGALEARTPASMRDVLHTNLLAPMLLTQALLPHLRRQPRAQVILRRLGARAHRPAGLQRVQRQQVRPARLRRGAAPRTRPTPAVRVQYLGPRSTRTGFNSAGVEAYNRATGTAMDAPAVVAEALAAPAGGRGRRAVPRLSRKAGRAPQRPGAGPLAGRRFRQATSRSLATLDADLHRQDLSTMRNTAHAPAHAVHRACWPPLALALIRAGAPMRRRPVDDAVAELQRDWEVIRYQTPAGRAREALRGAGRQGAQGQREPSRPRRAAGLGRHHRQLAGRREGRPGRARPGQAGQGAVRAGDPDRRQRARRLGLQQPGRAVLQGAGLAGRLRRQGQGAASCCRRRWRSTRRASTRTSSTASTWSRPGSRDEAVAYLERALQAPPRPGRQVADAGRREEARALLEKAKLASRRGAQRRAACRHDDAAAVRAVARADSSARRPCSAAMRCDDRHAQAAAAFGLAVRAVEALAQPRQLLGVKRRAVVLDSPAVAPKRSVDGAARRAHSAPRCPAGCAAARPADARRRARAAARAPSAAIRTPVRCWRRSASGRQSLIGLLDDGRASPTSARACAGRSARSTRDSASICVDQPVHALEAGAELGLGLRALGRAGGAAHHVPLRAQHRQRRAQLVRGIGGEAALARQHRLDAREQAVHRAQQRLQFGGHAAVGTGRRSSAPRALQLGRVARAAAPAPGAPPRPSPAAAPAAPAARARAG